MYESKGELLPDFIPPGPDDPLGAFALYLATPGYLIHGTNDQDSVGLYVSSGCIRMQKDAIAKLYEIVPIGTPVHLIHHANKAGWLGSKLYLQSYSSISLNEKLSYLNYKDAATAIQEAITDYPADIDWQLVQQTERQHKGVPIIIGVYKNDQSDQSQSDKGDSQDQGQQYQ
jgi:L,D-transpeptidase ErfK/SrfK